MRLSWVVIGFLALAGPAFAAPKSKLQSAPEFAGCTWSTARAGQMSLSGFVCKKAGATTRLVGDADLPGFWLESSGPDGVDRRLALRVFVKPAKGSLTTILERVRKASPGQDTASCRFAPYPASPYPGARTWALEPTGAARKAFDAGQVDQPCGALGVGQAGDRYFYLAKGRPDIVVLVDMGSEIQPFDPATLNLGRTPK